MEVRDQSVLLWLGKVGRSSVMEDVDVDADNVRVRRTLGPAQREEARAVVLAELTSLRGGLGEKSRSLCF